MTGQEYVQKTAKRIEKDKKKWDEFVANNPKVSKHIKNFFKDYRIGFVRKKVTIIQHDGTRWIGGGNDPRNKVYGDSAEAIIKQLLGIQW